MMPGSRCASIDLPVPGGPVIKRLWPPAAAISNAIRAVCCPLTSAKSGSTAFSDGLKDTADSAGGSISIPFKCAATCPNDTAPNAPTPFKAAACAAFSAGNTKARPALIPCQAIANAPRTGLSRPDNANSPANSYPSNLSAAT